MKKYKFKINNFFKKIFEASNYKLALKLANDWRDQHAPGGSVELIEEVI